MNPKLKQINLFPKSPIFLPNAMDGHFESVNIQFPAMIMDARHAVWRPGVAQKLAAISDLFIIDPSTHVLLFKDAKDGQNFKKLGYPNNIEIENIYSDSGFRKDKIIRVAVDDQLNKNASVVIAPYFFAEDTDDVKFGINISMLSETIRYLQETKNDVPVFAMLEIGSSVLSRPTVVNYVVDRFKEDFRDDVKGYIVVINDLDCETADQDSLLELSKLVFQLSEGTPVLVNKIGPFGEILCAIGASGYGSGLASGEIFRAKNLQSTPKGWGKKIEKTYIPEIFDYLNDEDLKTIKYTCKCAVCAGSYPKDTVSKKLHFLFTRLNSVETLQDTTRIKRIDIVNERIVKGIKLNANWRSKAIGVKTAFLPRWKAVLDLAKYWEFPDKDNELNALLSELES
ncbi:MAG: hypothetical protein HZB59_06845 [Ignavibacteriales bacterium]|nr:hypothetical protein [Ignavibacteriales bacterium]